MYIIHVRMQARPEAVEKLLALASFNARESRREPGNLRFDVSRGADDPLRFMLYEVYRDEAAFAAHQQTAHYARWKAEIGDLLAAPRMSERYVSVVPEPWI